MLRGYARGMVLPAIEAGFLVAPESRQPAPGASRTLRRIYQGALRAMPLQHRRDRAHSPRVVMAPPLRRSILPLSRPRTRRRRRRRQRRRVTTAATVVVVVVEVVVAAAVVAAAHRAGTAYTTGAATSILVHDFDSCSLSARNSPISSTS